MVLRREVPVEGAEGHVGGGGDVAHLYGVVATFGCQRHGRLDDALPPRRLVAGTFAGDGRGGFGHEDGELLDPFEDGAGAEGAAAAHGDERGALASALELV